MNSGEIVEAIKRKDWTLIEQGVQVDAASAPEIEALLEDDDPEIRELALTVLNNMGGGPAREAILQALGDENINVRSAAGLFLMTNYDREDLPRLLENLVASQDELVRERIALVIGRIGGLSAVSPLRRQAGREADPNAKHAMQIALARLGDDAARTEYRRRLHGEDPAAAAGALEDFRYVEDRAFLPDIIALLDDSRDAVNVGTSARDRYVRVCDVAVNVLDEVLEHPFPFATKWNKRYTQEELAEARKALRGGK